MNVLLLNPWEGEVFPPPAIGYLQAAILEKCPDVAVRAADLLEGLALLETVPFDVVAVTYHSFSVKFAREIRARTKAWLICGGHHPTAMPQQMLDIGYDQVITGEGENAIVDILQKRTGLDTMRIIKSSVTTSHYATIDAFPFPVFDGLYWAGGMGVPVISSRGCPYGCGFCASTLFWERRWHGRNPENILQEIYTQRQRYGIQTFMFEDDNFTLDRTRVFAVCHALRDAKLGMTWQCASRADTLADPELCRALYDAGCRTVWLGVESLSDAALARAGKQTTAAKMLQGILMARRAGLDTMSQFIVGLPGDNAADIKETVNRMRSVGRAFGRRGTNIAWVLPGTTIYTAAKARGFQDETYLQTGAPFYTYEQDINTLNHWAHQINTA